MTPRDEAPVTQADREAANTILKEAGVFSTSVFRALVQAFARHRQAAEAEAEALRKEVEALRAIVRKYGYGAYGIAADYRCRFLGSPAMTGAQEVGLKPCPFCGGEAHVFHAFPKAEEGWVVEAEHDETCPLISFMGERQCYASADIAALAWNARVPNAWNTLSEIAMTDAREVAERLTKALAWQLRQATATTDGRWHVKSNSVTKAGPWPEGLTEYYSWALDRLTPLGLEVRRILMEKDHDQG